MSKRKLVRLTALLFGVSLLLGACSGNGLSSELETIRAELEVLREELAGTKERLAEAQAENRALDDRITDLEAAGEYPIFRQTLDNGVTLIYELGQLDVGYNPLVERRASRLYVRYADGERRQVGGERGLSSISVSPDGTRLLYNDGFAGNFDAADGAEPAVCMCMILIRAELRGWNLTGFVKGIRPRLRIGWTIGISCLSSSLRPARSRSAATCVCMTRKTIPSAG